MSPRDFFAAASQSAATHGLLHMTVPTRHVQAALALANAANQFIAACDKGHAADLLGHFKSVFAEALKGGAQL